MASSSVAGFLALCFISLSVAAPAAESNKDERLFGIQQCVNALQDIVKQEMNMLTSALKLTTEFPESQLGVLRCLTSLNPLQLLRCFQNEVQSDVSEANESLRALTEDIEGIMKDVSGLPVECLGTPTG